MMRILRTGMLVAIAALTGCITLDQKLVIRGDGSGTCEFSYSVSEQTIEQMRAMLQLRRQMAIAAGEANAEHLDVNPHYMIDIDEDRIRTELSKYEKLGLSVERLTTDNRKERRSVYIEARFENLAKLAEADFFQEYGFSLFRNEQGNYVLYRAPSADPGELPVEMSDPATVRNLTPLLSGFRIVASVTVPRAIIETNASRPSQFTAEWEYDFDKNPEALLDLQRTEMRVVFDGEGVKLPRVRHARSDSFLSAGSEGKDDG